MRVEIKPDMLRWARERAGFTLVDLAPRFPHLAAWEHREALPTLKQIAAAQAVIDAAPAKKEAVMKKYL